METKENKANNDLNATSENVVVKNKLRNARKEGLTKGALTAGIIGLILLMGLGVLGYSRYTREHNSQLALMENQKQIFTEQLTERDSMINDWLISFDEIENNLSAIKQKEKIITVKTSDTEFSKNRKNQVLEDIRDINSLIDENKKKIARLSAQLNKSGNTITGLQTRITQLEASMQQYEADITALKATLVNKDFEIGQLNTRVFALNDTLTMKDETINSQISKLNQAFVATGTYKDLKGKGLLLKEGGFLGLGRNESLISDFPDSLFEIIDVTETKTIPVNSKNAKLITEHPSGSYEMIRENEKTIAYIEIKDPEEFWKISKYAVVEIVK
jgi:predicted  nucleic acid-binding Zn-ribbon protein